MRQRGQIRKGRMTEKTIAVVGAGPGVGMAVAERFGRAGYRVALLARNVSRLRDLASRLEAKGIQTEVFEADVLDRSDLAESLDEAAQRLGPIDVLEYSPVPPMASMRQPRDIDVENELFQLDFSVLGAIAAVGAVLHDRTVGRSPPDSYGEFWRGRRGPTALR
jgi:short-subunit dehydrogenase